MRKSVWAISGPLFQSWCGGRCPTAHPGGTGLEAARSAAPRKSGAKSRWGRVSSRGCPPPKASPYRLFCETEHVRVKVRGCAPIRTGRFGGRGVLPSPTGPDSPDAGGVDQRRHLGLVEEHEASVDFVAGDHAGISPTKQSPRADPQTGGDGLGLGESTACQSLGLRSRRSK